ncbi:MAG: hypothetical protein F6J93_05645 [Oscillatoria sp. SIO1A7]|nr:hypothetical protein [Oscillatoria sp. SIO1A7]
MLGCFAPDTSHQFENRYIWSHPLLEYSLTLSGNDGSDAERYQEKDVKNALIYLDKLTDKEEE